MFSKLKNLRGKKEATLAWNTFMLLILNFTTQFLSIIIVPYETNILGEVTYGVLAVAMKVTLYVQVLIDFGFILSATEEVAKHRDDPHLLSVIMTAITVCKLMLALFSLVVLSILCLTLPKWDGRLGLYLACYAGTTLNALMPDYLYRGLEKMTAITVRTVLIRLFTFAGILLMLKSPSDLWIIPTLTAIGNALAIGACFLDAKRRLNVWFCRINLQDVSTRFRKSAVFFFSRFASTMYSTMNTLVLDSVAPSGSRDNGLYGLANQLMDTGKNAVSPISDSLYPYMVKNHDYKMVKKVLLIVEPLIIAFCSVVFAVAPWFCSIFGDGFRDAGNVLRVMLPTAVIILPSYICGFPMLTSMGLAKYANYSTVFGSIIHVFNLALLFLTHNVSMITLGAAMSVAEFMIFAYRLVVIWRHRDRLKENAHVDS